MSISAISGSDSFGLAEMMQSRRNSTSDPGEFASSIVEKDDQDGDGFLSLAETRLDEDRFNKIDADSDGLISTDELSADAEARMAEGPPPMQGMEGMAMGDSDETQSSSGSGEESSSEEEYDELDLNKDGVVSMDELLQAYQQGDTSLQSLFDGLGGGNTSLVQRLANEAYLAQSAV
ncbi:MAG: EF-hand domain-containing protein [Pseudodesulfovibrio sp.]|jgi:hypothetical protein|uniref:EF-hand domain-containing protein n=1 Tax=Pseudodesulfovibrio sp. TaxID=2035812 RepID=UPI003D0E7A07